MMVGVLPFIEVSKLPAVTAIYLNTEQADLDEYNF